MRNNKSRLAGLFLVVSTLLAVFAFTSSAAQAAETQEEVCYEQVAYVEYQFKRTETTPAVEEVSHVEYKWDIETRTEIKQPQIEKQVKGVIQTKDRGDWKNTGTFDWIDYPDAGPLYDDARIGTSGPHSSTFNQTGNGNGSTRYVSTTYRYVETGVTRSYTPPRYTAWAPAGSTPWGLSSTPPADTATTRYVNKQERTIIDVPGSEEFTTEFYYTGDEVGSPYAVDAIWTRSNPGKPWEQYNERSGYDQVEVDCPPVTTVPPTTTPPTTEPPVTTVPPTTQPPVDTTVPPTVATSVPPVPTVPPTVPPATPTELPATGTNNGLLALAAAGMIALGGLFIAATRRQQVN